MMSLPTRRLLLACSGALLLICAAFANAQPVRAPAKQDTITLSYLFSDGNMTGTLEAWRSLLKENPELKDRVQLNFLTESFFDSADPAKLQGSNVMVLDMMNQNMLDRYNKAHDTDLIRDIAAKGKVLAVGVGVQPKEYFTGQGALWDDRAMAYWQNSGRDNQLSLMKLALQKAGVSGLRISDPKPSLDFGYYYPDGNGGRVFADWKSFDDWRRANGKSGSGKPRVAVGFYKSSYYDSETAVIDAVIAEIERQGGEAVPFFGYPDGVAFERMLVDEQGHARADVALSLLMRFADFSVTQHLTKLNIPVINLITLYGRSVQDWQQSPSGLSQFEGTFQAAVPELAGLVAPTVVGSREKRVDAATGLAIVVNQPIPERIAMAVKRGLRYQRLQHKANADRHIAFMYYNYPVGKSNIGASYLNIAESLANILADLKQQGYDVGDKPLDADSILNDITNKARNVGSFAPGELDAMLKQGSVAQVPVSTYRQWLDELDPALRAKLLKDWGDPTNDKLMTTQHDGQTWFVIPRLQYGNILLMPQPIRGWSEDLEKLYHAHDLAPPHQYVAVYRWLHKAEDIDAIVHMGTHGTLEWLDGKDMGLMSADASDALMADIPDLYIYNVDVVGEGLVARRRGMATLIDHMVPPFVEGGLYPELAKLGESINDYDVNLEKNAELSQAYGAEVVKQVIALGIDKTLGLDLAGKTAIPHEQVHQIQDYVVQLKRQSIPYGLHAFGRLPTAAMRKSTVDAIVNVDRSLLPDAKQVLRADMDRRIVASATQELASLGNALKGGYVQGGSGGEPIRNPDAYPTGKDFYGIDPDKVPKKAAWAMGVKLADDMLAKHLKQHGSYPQKVSFVIWGDETMRHEGVLESQIFYLLGTRPVWDARDKVVGVEVIPQSQLKRPRVDIVIASAAEGMFNNVTVLMDQAVQKVKALEETQNFVRDHYLATRAKLQRMGYSAEDADRRAGVRIFDEPPGIYNLNTSNIAAASGSWDSDIGMANDYIEKMGHGFGNGFWGEPMQETFRLALDGVEQVVHSSSTMQYGTLDNDDFFMYMGGLAAAVRNVSGKNPELVVTNTRDPGKPSMDTLDKFMGSEMQSRYLNPTWMQGMMKEGYAGARTMTEFVEYLWGWDATVNDVVDDRMWQDVFEVYVQDRNKLDLQKFFDEKSPYAFQAMAARMVETIRKQYWKADEATRKQLLTAYLDSVQKHGLDCSETSCGNARLMQYVLDEGARLKLDGVALAAFKAAVEAATKTDIAQRAKAMAEFARSNDARTAADFKSKQAPALAGYRMEKVEQNAPQQQNAAAAPEQFWSGVLVQALILLALLGWWYRRRVAAR